MLTGMNGSAAFFLVGGVLFVAGAIVWYYRKPRRGRYVDYDGIQTANAPLFTFGGLAFILFGILNWIFGFLA